MLMLGLLSHSDDKRDALVVGIMGRSRTILGPGWSDAPCLSGRVWQGPVIVINAKLWSQTISHGWAGAEYWCCRTCTIHLYIVLPM